MTVLSTENRIDYVGNGVLATYPIPFRIFKASDLKVYVNGNIETDYTVAGDLSELTFNAGSIPAAAAGIAVLRVLDETQETSYPSNDKFPAKVHEATVDRNVMLVQQVSERLGRVPQLALTSLFKDLTLPDPVSGRALRYKADPSGFETFDPNVVPVGSLALPVAIANGGTGASDLPTVRNNLQAQAALKGSNVASASTLALSSAGNYFEVTGTTTINAISAQNAGNVLYLRFQGALTLTHSANLLLLGGGNARTAAGDLSVFIAEAGAVWREIWRQPADGQLQHRRTTTISLVNSTTETSLLGGAQTLPANYLGASGAGRVLRLRAYCSMTNNSGGNVMANFRVKLGATTLIATSPSFALSSGITGAEFRIDVEIIRGTTGQSAFLTVWRTGGASPIHLNMRGTGAEDMAVSQTYDLTVQLDVASASASMQLWTAHSTLEG
jgi:hypothetical protein